MQVKTKKSERTISVETVEKSLLWKNLFEDGFFDFNIYGIEFPTDGSFDEEMDEIINIIEADDSVELKDVVIYNNPELFWHFFNLDVPKLNRLLKIALFLQSEKIIRIFQEIILFKQTQL